jgi:hypothetical protein
VASSSLTIKKRDRSHTSQGYRGRARHGASPYHTSWGCTCKPAQVLAANCSSCSPIHPPITNHINNTALGLSERLRSFALLRGTSSCLKRVPDSSTSAPSHSTLITYLPRFFARRWRYTCTPLPEGRGSICHSLEEDRRNSGRRSSQNTTIVTPTLLLSLLRQTANRRPRKRHTALGRTGTKPPLKGRRRRERLLRLSLSGRAFVFQNTKAFPGPRSRASGMALLGAHRLITTLSAPVPPALSPATPSRLHCGTHRSASTNPLRGQQHAIKSACFAPTFL